MIQRRRCRAPDERGFALITVLLVLALLGVVGAEFSYSMRLEASAVRAYRDFVIGAHLAEAAVEQAVREVLGDFRLAATCEDGPLSFYTADRTAVPLLPRDDVPLGSGSFSYRITDEESRVNLNVAPPARVDALLRSIGVEEKQARDTIVDSIQDWRDPNEEYRLHGAESEDTYLRLPLPYRARNGNLESVRELLQIKGISRETYQQLAPWVAVRSAGQANINTASEHVLRAYGLSEAEISQILQSRCDGPYAAVPGQFGGRGLGVVSLTYRIDAEGKVGGRTGARIVAVVQRRAGPAGPTITYLEWSGPQ